MLLLLAAVTLLRVPDGGIQPQVVQEPDGTAHVIYLKGPAAQSDIYYTKTRDGRTFTPPLRVNSKPGAAIATGTIRGPHLAVGAGGRAHVAWMGSSATAKPAPMLYTRLDDSGRAFEPERNVITKAWGLDGGGSVAADGAGRVYVAWHAPEPGKEGEEHRKIWVAVSEDGGKTFAPERAAWSEATGSCACCGMRAFADARGTLRILYRGAREMVHRDMYLIESRNRAETLEGRKVDEWNVGACMMSSAALGDGLAAWETRGQVHAQAGEAKLTPAGDAKRKHPVVARNQRGETLLAWLEGTGWNRGGALAWQLFDKNGAPISERGRTDGVPPWSLAAVFARPDGSFVVLY